MTQAATTEPAGYRANAKGHLVPEHMISGADILTDDLVGEIAKQWKEKSAELKALKENAVGDVHALIATINEKYNVKKGGEKGNTQLFTYDGRYKLAIRVNETIGFGPELQAAREKITECLQEWVGDARPELKVIVNEAFATDGQGGVRVGRILQLRRYKIESDEWHDAMAALDDALRVVGTKQYILLYERNGAGGYDPIPLDIAAL